MYDVARAAGVSQTTVSFVVNNAPNTTIPQETRDRVWSAVEELGWRPNAMARSLSLQRSNTIGLISDEIATSSHAGRIIQGAQAAAWAHNKMLLVINTDNNREVEHAGLEMLLERQVEGIIYATMYHHEVAPPHPRGQVPIVLLDCYATDHSLPSVVPDEVQGGRTATELLLRKGHRRIGFVNEIGPIAAMVGRLEGYKQALASFGVPFDANLVRSGASIAANGYRCALELMQLPDRPTALFCFNDSMAMGAYDAVKQLGLTIPNDVAIIGFDNLEVIAAQLQPPLTTMELPHYEMGQWAVHYLLDHADDAQPEPVQHAIACPLIERNSV
ncbi:MAG TPA: LacI family DNA-binding transcriptional regulator [Roseiflexaceae bacterium]|jgi:LacI family transcriptional regulator|nr:LacI family DNA-binding transcriptional regulator [Roseiflexaceae bacterium]